jgi:hypothetical protein
MEVILKRTLPDGTGADASQATAEESSEISPPLLDEVGRANDESASNKSQTLHLTEVHPGHDRLAGTRLIGQKEAKEWLRKHCPVDSVGLVRVRPERSRCQCRRFRLEGGCPHPLGPQPRHHELWQSRTVLLEDLDLGQLLSSERDFA